MRFVVLAILALSAAPATHAARLCTPPAVKVAQTDPTRATLTWARSAAAVGYFIQYSTGKFPSQESWTPAPDETTATVELRHLQPGHSYTIELCEAYEPGACPAGPASNACTSLVELTAATAWPDAVQPDPRRAACIMTPDVAILGETPGHPYDDPAPAATADDCCSQCASAEPWLPYTAQCTHFIFDPTAQQCFLRRERIGDTPAPGAVSGEVRAWPAPTTP